MPTLSLGSYKNGYNTPLSKADEERYQTYRLSLGDRGDDTDYDLRGYFMKYGQNEDGHDGHFTDEFKKPSHPTFSEESQYHLTPANDNGDLNKGGKWVNGKDYLPHDDVLSDPDKLKALQWYWMNSDEKGKVITDPKQRYDDFVEAVKDNLK